MPTMVSYDYCVMSAVVSDATMMSSAAVNKEKYLFILVPLDLKILKLAIKFFFHSLLYQCRIKLTNTIQGVPKKYTHFDNPCDKNIAQINPK